MACSSHASKIRSLRMWRCDWPDGLTFQWYIKRTCRCRPPCRLSEQQIIPCCVTCATQHIMLLLGTAAQVPPLYSQLDRFATGRDAVEAEQSCCSSFIRIDIPRGNTTALSYGSGCMLYSTQFPRGNWVPCKAWFNHH
jgi:hypothetical protein